MRWLVCGLVAAVTVSSSAAAEQGPPAAGAPRLEDLLQKIDRLAGEIEDANLEVDLLKDTALTGEVGRTHGVIMHQNGLGAGYRLEAVRYVLDGRELLKRATPDFDLRRTKVMPIYTGFITPGDHLLEVEARVRSGTFGIFTYAEGYTFQVRSRYILKIREGRRNRLDVVFTQKEDVSLSAEQRLQVRYDFEVKSGLPITTEGRAESSAAGEVVGAR
jgi:hypothetical protein